MTQPSSPKQKPASASSPGPTAKRSRPTKAAATGVEISTSIPVSEHCGNTESPTEHTFQDSAATGVESSASIPVSEDSGNTESTTEHTPQDSAETFEQAPAQERPQVADTSSRDITFLQQCMSDSRFRARVISRLVKRLG